MSLRQAFQGPAISRMSDYNAEEILRRLDIASDNNIEAESIRFLFREMCGYRRRKMPVIEKYKSVIESAMETLEYKLGLLRKFETEFFSGQSYNRDALILTFITDDYLSNVNASLYDDDGNPIGRRNDFSSDMAEDAAIMLQEAQELEAAYAYSVPIEKEVSFLAQISTLMDTEEIVKNIDEYETEDLKSHYRHASNSVSTYIGEDSPIGKDIVANALKIREEIEARRPTATIIPFQAPTR